MSEQIEWVGIVVKAHGRQLTIERFEYVPEYTWDEHDSSSAHILFKCPVCDKTHDMFGLDCGGTQ